jgi:hypothetical protein
MHPCSTSFLSLSLDTDPAWNPLKGFFYLTKLMLMTMMLKPELMPAAAEEEGKTRRNSPL